MIRTSALALCYSVAEYACPVWQHSCHAKKLDPPLNTACRIIAGCLKPINTMSLYRKRDTLKWQTEGTRFTTINQPSSTWSALLSWTLCLITMPQNLSGPTSGAIEQQPFLWRPPWAFQHLRLAPGKNLQWTTWMSLNRLRTDHGRAADLMHNWGY